MNDQQKGKLIGTMKELQGIVEEALGPLGDSMVKAMAFSMMSGEAIREALTPPPPEIPSLATIRMAKPTYGCPYLVSLRWHEPMSSVGVSKWVGDCTITDYPCEIKLGLGEFYECINHKAKRYMDSRAEPQNKE